MTLMGCELRTRMIFAMRENLRAMSNSAAYNITTFWVNKLQVQTTLIYMGIFIVLYLAHQSLGLFQEHE